VRLGACKLVDAGAIANVEAFERREPALLTQVMLDERHQRHTAAEIQLAQVGKLRDAAHELGHGVGRELVAIAEAQHTQ